MPNKEQLIFHYMNFINFCVAKTEKEIEEFSRDLINFKIKKSVGIELLRILQATLR